MFFKNCLIKFLHIIGPGNKAMGGFLVCSIAVVVGLFIGILTQWWSLAWAIALLVLVVLMIAALWVEDL